MIMKHAVAATALLLALGLAGCESAPENRGQSGRRVDPARDAPSELGSTTPRSEDVVVASDRMAMDIAQRLDINDRENPPRIVVGQIENRSSIPYQDYQIFLVRLRGLLQQAGTRHGLEFIREAAYIEQQREREFGDKDPTKTAEAYRSRAEYVLTCEIYDLPSGGTNYYLFSYQLVQIVDQAQSGPDVGAGAIVWENTYEVKYQ